MELNGKVALTTGASSGIGRGAAKALAREGATVGLVGRDEEALEVVAGDIAADGGAAFAVVADLRSLEEGARAVDEVAAHDDRLDVLVNAAGIIATGDIETTTLEGWSDMMRINLDSAFALMRAAVPYLRASRGSIVNVSSVTGLRAFPNVLGYCVSKAGLDQLTRCAALELAPSGVRVNAVNPGVVETDLHRRGGMEEAAYREFLEHSRSTHPLGRVGQPEDIAEAILYLASERAAWVTGVTLELDGGRHLTCAR